MHFRLPWAATIDRAVVRRNEHQRSLLIPSGGKHGLLFHPCRTRLPVNQSRLLAVR